MHHPIQLCVRMRARAPPPQRSQRREVRENPGRFLDQASTSMVNPPSSEIPGKRQRRELRGFSMLQKPPVLVSNLIMCSMFRRRVFATATFSTLSGPTGSARERNLATPRSAAEKVVQGMPKCTYRTGPARTSRTSSRWLQGSARLELLGPRKGS